MNSVDDLCKACCTVHSEDSHTTCRPSNQSTSRKLALKWHPDKNPHCIKVGDAKIKKINEAYAELKSPQQRQDYDERLQRDCPWSQPGMPSSFPPPPYKDGDHVTIHEQTDRPELNGQPGQVLRCDFNTGFVTIKLLASHDVILLELRMEHLRPRFFQGLRVNVDGVAMTGRLQNQSMMIRGEWGVVNDVKREGYAQCISVTLDSGRSVMVSAQYICACSDNEGDIDGLAVH